MMSKNRSICTEQHKQSDSRVCKFGKQGGYKYGMKDHLINIDTWRSELNHIWYRNLKLESVFDVVYRKKVHIVGRGNLSDNASRTSKQQRNGVQSDKQSNQVSAFFKKSTPWNSYHVIIA